MSFTRRQKSGSAAVAAAAVSAAAVILATVGGSGASSAAGPQYIGYLERVGQGEEAEEERERDRERPEPVVGGANAESAEIFNALTSVANARLAPRGSVPAGELSAELGDFKALGSNGSAWDEVTDLPYNADDPDYRDPSFSNSSGGSGYVAGRITGLAAGDGYLFAGGANGGVFRKQLGNRATGAGDGPWVPISDRILSLSTGDLVYDEAHDTLWYATGEANTGATSYTGAGVYRLADATTATFTDADRVGGTELESRGINQLKVDAENGLVYAATTRGLWRHGLTGDAPWQLVLMPNPGSDADITKPYDNMVNDVAIQPGSGAVLANAAWRSGAAYNGFYFSPDGAAGSFTRVNPTGALKSQDVGNTEFAFSADGSKLYAVVESPNKLNHSPQTVLDGVFVSPSGTLQGPWNRIATSGKLAASGSALGGGGGVFYRPGVQAWYNNFIEVDPTDPEHVYLGLEEVFETTNGGETWSTPGPYWNFGFSCWDISDPQGGCPQSTHPDQHSIAIDEGYVYVGNDGGVKSRPVAPAQSKEDSLNHGSDWLNHSQGLGTLQYYSVGVGKDGTAGYLVAGGLQDNGGSLLRAGAAEMVSPFGGDGGDIIVDADNGCQILDEYVYLNLWMTKNCGKSKGDESVIFDVTVPDPNPRFTAPFRVVRGSQNTVDGDSERWVAGGNKVWTHDKAFAYTRAEAAADATHGWRKIGDLGTGGRMTVGLDAIANPSAPKDASKDVVYAAWCGESNCNSAGFTSGVATSYGGTWRELAMKDGNTTLPNRYPNAVWIDEKASASGNTVYLVYNGYNRRFIEGPGADGVTHVYKGVVTSTTPNADGSLPVDWTDISGNMPNVPATDVLRVGNALVVGTDYGVIVSGLDGGTWRRVGASPGSSAAALPLTTVYDLHAGPDGYLYAATHGRGIWRTSLSGLTG